MQSKKTVKIIIDKRTLDTLIRLGVSDENLLMILKKQRYVPTGDELTDDYLSTLFTVKEFSNWGGNRKNGGRKPKNNQLDFQDDNQLDFQDDCNLDDKDKDKDIDIYVTGNSVTGNSVTDSKEKKKNIQKKKERKRNAQTLFDETEFYQETIPDSLKEIAAKLNPFQNAQPTYEAFKDYNLQHARKAADWKAAWRNWLRSKYNSNFKDISHVLNREAVKNQMAHLEQMKAQGDEFFIQRARTRLKQIIEQELEK